MAEGEQDANLSVDSSATESLETNQDKTLDSAKLLSDKESGGKSEQLPFHEHPRFKELIEEKNSLRSEVEKLRSQVASTLSQREEINPTEKVFKKFRDAGVDEKTAKLLAEANVEAAELVSNKRVAPVEAATIQQAIDVRVSEFAKEHEDYADLQPRMYDVFKSLPEEDKDYISRSPSGLQFLYDHVKSNMTEEEKAKAYKDGVQKGYQSKKMKESASPTSGASTKTPQSEWTEDDIANMSLEEYRKNRSAIIASRAPKRR